MESNTTIQHVEGCSLTVEELADRWKRRPLWIARAARQGEIPGAWKLGHLWRFKLSDIEAYETAQQNESIFALTPLSAKRQKW